MQRNINSLIGYTMGATDGEIGKVEDFYFDDQSWSIRYLVVKTGSWLSGRKVLISPDALIRKYVGQETFPVTLSKKQIRNSPDIDTHNLVSRQQEIELYGYYPWRPCWGSGFYANTIWEATNASLVTDATMIKEVGNHDKRSDDDQHLRSTFQVTGYHIHATDGAIGHVKDFIINNQTWELQYFVADTHNLPGGKKVLISVKHIKEIQWYRAKIFVDITIDSIKDSLVFDKPEFAKQEISDKVY